MARTDTQFNHRIPQDLKDEFDEEAKKAGRSSTQHLIHVLKNRNDKISISDKLNDFIDEQEKFNTSLLTVLRKANPGIPRITKPVVKNTRILKDNIDKHFSKYTVTALRRNDINIIRDLTLTTASEASKWIGIGKIKLDEINAFMLRNGFKYINK